MYASGTLLFMSSFMHQQKVSVLSGKCIFLAASKIQTLSWKGPRRLHESEVHPLLAYFLGQDICSFLRDQMLVMD